MSESWRAHVSSSTGLGLREQWAHTGCWGDDLGTWVFKSDQGSSGFHSKEVYTAAPEWVMCFCLLFLQKGKHAGNWTWSLTQGKRITTERPPQVRSHLKHGLYSFKSHVCVSAWAQVPADVKRGCQISSWSEGSYELPDTGRGWEAVEVCWELTVGPLKEQHTPLTTEPPLQFLVLFFCIFRILREGLSYLGCPELIL